MSPAPDAEVVIDAGLVRRLLRDQQPDLAGLPLTEGPQGWDNHLWRLGEDLVVRLPRRALAAELVAHEARWLPGLAHRLPLPVPAPVRVGAPGAGYPWTWTVVPWLPGREAGAARQDGSLDLPTAAEQLATFFAALHREPPPQAPHNPFRGGPLTDRDAAFGERVSALPAGDRSEATGWWREALSAPPWAGAPRWLHGDPHPRNLLARDARLAAVLDWGDLCAGDPATDLAGAWLLLDAPSRGAFWDAYAAHAAYDVDDALRARARGWALHYTLMLRAHVADDPAWAPVIDHAWEQLADPP